jgi:hypothetical protein
MEVFMAKLDKNRLIFGLFLIILIAIGEIIFHVLHVPAWPAFLIMIFFFMAHMDKKQAPNMLVGGAFGILMIIAAKIIVTSLVGAGLDQFVSFLIFVLVFVYCIVALGEILPILFNNYAFMALLFTATYMQTPNPQNPFVLTAILLIGGGIFIIGILGIVKLLMKLASPK